MTGQIILSGTSAAGQQFEVRLHAALPGVHVAQLFVDGAAVPSPTRAQRLPSPDGERSHFLGGGLDGRQDLPRVELTAAEAAQIEAALLDANEAFRQSAEGRLSSLRAEREELDAALRELEEEAWGHFERAYARGEASAAWEARRSYEPQIEAARQALRDFDAAHPEAASDPAPPQP